jgi:anaerobic selenocysteine-containing dehydrogenase
MAEAHPVGFQWVMEAKARGATVIHVDPRFSRTSALADLHVPIRAGADIAFVGGLINYVISNEKYFRDYVINYTNAPAILTEDFAGTEDTGGVFSGLDADQRTYDFATWRYQGEEVRPASGQRGLSPEQLRELRQAARGEAHGSGGAAAHPRPDTDVTLQYPRCVFQVLKRHFARYTPDMVAKITGVPEELFDRAAATAAAAGLGCGVATYTAVLICDTAVPAWHEGYREMPFLFAGSAASAAGGLGLLAVSPERSREAARFAVLGAAAELTAKSLMMRRLGAASEPYQAGRAGRLMDAGEMLAAIGLAGCRAPCCRAPCCRAGAG